MIALPAMIAGRVVPWRLIGYSLAAIAIAGATYSGYRYIVRIGHAEMQPIIDKERAERAAEQLAQSRADNAELKKALQVTKDLGNIFDQLKKESQANEIRIRNLHAAALDSLRNRPEARAATESGLPDPASTGKVGCTGAGLAKADAAFLAGYAADAARNADALTQCRAGYQAAKASLDKLSNSDK